MDERFSRLLADGEPLLTLKDSLVLVELSFAVPAINLREILFDMQLKGYQPVLAHPERYLYFGAIGNGMISSAMPAVSSSSTSFPLPATMARTPGSWRNIWIKKQYVDLLGTDLHHEKHLETLRSSVKIHRMVADLMQTGLIKNPQL